MEAMLRGKRGGGGGVGFRFGLLALGSRWRDHSLDISSLNSRRCYRNLGIFDQLVAIRLKGV